MQDDGHSTDAVTSVAPVAIVHAYADKPYDRSSFHLAGRSDSVSDVASRLICNALNEIDLENNKSGDDEESRHPFVGLVDHVAVIPLAPVNNNDSSNDVGSKCEAAANAAREIGRQISKTNLVNVYYYGMACPQNTPLATVRRERTSFFKSGGAIDIEVGNKKDVSIAKEATTLPNIALKGDTTIGTPSNFVENFNIRLTSNVNFDQAKTLTQFVRGRNINAKGYGVVGVEALTLPYVREAAEGGKVYEVACNLTNPEEGGVDDIRAQLEKWIDRQRQQSSQDYGTSGATDKDACKFNYDYFVEDAYRVGTTEEQCIHVLSNKEDSAGVSTNELFWEEYDKEVYHKFQDFLQ